MRHRRAVGLYITHCSPLPVLKAVTPVAATVVATTTTIVIAVVHIIAEILKGPLGGDIFPCLREAILLTETERKRG